MITKKDIARAVARRADITIGSAQTYVDATLDEITVALIDKQKVGLMGLGVFDPQFRGSRMGRNPKTGEPVRVGSRTVIKFKPSRNLKEVVNGPAR